MEVLLLDEPDAACGDVIWVGRSEKLGASVPQVCDPKQDDAFDISVRGCAGYITGTNERSVLIAAYRFLKELGCRWIRPGEEGLRVERKELTDFTVSLQEAADCRYRCVCIEGAVAYDHVLNMIDYLPKVGMSDYYIQFIIPATFFENWHNHSGNVLLEDKRLQIEHTAVAGMVRKLEAEIKKRGIRYHKVGHGWTAMPFGMDGTGWHRDAVHNIPEETVQYLAEINGVRGLKNNSPLDTQLCYSKKEVRDRMTDYIVEYCRQNPHVDVLRVWMADNLYNWCECEDCRKLRAADWCWMILNELDEKLTAAGLDTKISQTNGIDKMWPPLQTRIKNTDRLILQHCPILRGYDKTYADCTEGTGKMTEYKLNNNEYPRDLQDCGAYLREYQKLLNGEMFLFDYHLIWPFITDPGMEKIAKVLFEDMRNLKNVGLNGMDSCQLQRVAFPTNLPQHIMAETLWDNGCDFDRKADEYYLAAFGPDGLQVRTYLSEISEKMILLEKRRFGDPECPMGPFCTDYERVYQLLKDFLPVIREHAAGNDQYAKDWKYLELHNRYTELFAQAFQQQEQGRTDAMEEKVLELIRLVSENEDWTHSVLDVSNVSYFFKRRIATTRTLMKTQKNERIGAADVVNE